MDGIAKLYHVFWKAGCVTKGACPVWGEATRNLPPKGGKALVAYFTFLSLLQGPATRPLPLAIAGRWGCSVDLGAARDAVGGH